MVRRTRRRSVSVWLAPPMLVMALLAGCGNDEPAVAPGGDAAAAKVEAKAEAKAEAKVEAKAGAKVDGRWYTPERVRRGGVVFAENCAVCHGKSAQGAFAWRKPGPDGKFLPPPLDDTGHAWHHPFIGLASQIKFGAAGGQGAMPGFAETLNGTQIGDVIAWIQDRWPDKIYRAWLATDKRARTGG